MGYLGYYAAWLALSYVVRQPWLLVGLLALWLLRGVLPGPSALFGALSRAGRLRQQVELNRANVTARRDLATLYLDLLRPRRALELLEEGLALSPEDPELLYLSGVALHRAGRHDDALARLLAALEKDARLRHGQPYFVAGQTLLALKRWDDATDAFERYQDFNSSDVAAHTALSRAQAGAGDDAAARKWLLAGLETWHALPGSLKRRQFGAYLRAQGARVTVLKQPAAIATAALLVAVVIYGVRASVPLVATLWAPNDSRALLARARQAMKQCGRQRTGDFEGSYGVTTEGAEEGARVLIQRDSIVDSRGEYVRNYCLTKVLARSPQSLHAEAVLRFRGADGEARDELLDSEQTAVIADMLLYDVRLDRGSKITRLRVAPVTQPMEAMILDLQREEP